MSSKLKTLLKEKLNIKTENIQIIKLKTVKDYINNTRFLLLIQISIY